MKLTKFLTFILPSLLFKSLLLATCLVAYSSTALAVLPVIDGANLGVNGRNNIELIKKNTFDQKQVELKQQELKDAAEKLKTEQTKINDEIENVKKEKKSLSGGAYIDFSAGALSDIREYETKKKTKLSQGAEKFFRNPDACKSDKPNYALVAGLVLPTSMPSIQDKLEYNCIAQRELKAMALQAAFEYSRVVERLKSHQKTAMTNITTTESGSAISSRVEAAVQLQNLYASQYDRFKEEVSMLEQMLLIHQRDWEIEQMRGRKGANNDLVSSVVKNAVMAGVLNNTRAVNGNRTTSFKANYAD
jgi:hypothetical protein